MIEHLFIRPSIVARLKGGPLGSYLDDLATILHQQGYAPSSIQRCLRTGDLFGRWLQGQGYDLTQIDAVAIQHYSYSCPAQHEYDSCVYPMLPKFDIALKPTSLPDVNCLFNPLSA